MDFLYALSGFCVRIQIFRCLVSCAYVYGFFCTLSGFLRMDTAFSFIERLSDTILRILWFFRSPFDPILRVCWFVRSPEDPILRVSLIRWKSLWILVMIGPSGESIWRIQSSGLLVWRYVRYYWIVSRIFSSGFRCVLYPTIFTRFTVWFYLINFLSDNLLAIQRPIILWIDSCWSWRAIYNPAE